MENSDLNSMNKTDDVVAYNVLDASENTQAEDDSDNLELGIWQYPILLMKI